MAEVNTCHCCDGLSVKTPMQIDNRPGLKMVAYRVGDHSRFKQSLLARLTLSGDSFLRQLTTRETSDFTIGLLDSWSVVADVLTFYQERIANESYLRTATERFSILEMARMIGYELNPGVAASTYVAFTLDDTPGALGPVLGSKNHTNLLEGLPPITIEKGIRVQSIPGPGEKAQTFETTDDIEARAEWNAMKPKLTTPQVPLNSAVIVFTGIETGLKKGDTLLVHNNASPELRKVLNVEIDNDSKTTRAYTGPNPVLPKYVPPLLIMTAVFTNFVNLRPMVLQQANVVNMKARTWKEADFSALVKINKWSVHEISRGLNTPPVTPAPVPGTEIFAMRKKASVFGYNAPKISVDGSGHPLPPNAWGEWPISATEKDGLLYLDNAYDEILPDSQVVIQNPASATKLRFYQATSINTTSRTAYGISTKTTAISLSSEVKWWEGTADDTILEALRSITVYAQSERLELAELPIDDLIQGSTITLDKYYPGLKVGRPVILTGERDDLNGVLASEVVILSDVVIVDGLTVLAFEKSLVNRYKPKTVSINANIAKATHGETVQEVLGSGDATIPFQRFKLQQTPLTHTAAKTPTGTQSTLEIRVNDLLWKEVNYFLDHLPDERIYITRLDNEGKTTVIFGDGINGARLPTGQANIKAKYRKGIGLGGIVKANQLSQLLTMPLGVKAAVNPVPATGSEDPEKLEDARTNAPLTILTLGRIVSLQDYEDFARAFAGIGKSLATWIWKGQKRHVYITVAGSAGGLVEEGTPLYDNLLDEIGKAGNPGIAVTLSSYIPAFFLLDAGMKIHPAYLPEKVLAEVEKNLRDTFSFEKRRFGQPVNFSEVVACIQNTKGVVAVDINYLYRSDAVTPELKHNLESRMPNPVNENTVAAELLTLDPRPIELKILP